MSSKIVSAVILTYFYSSSYDASMTFGPEKYTAAFASSLAANT